MLFHVSVAFVVFKTFRLVHSDTPRFSSYPPGKQVGTNKGRPSEKKRREGAQSAPIRLQSGSSSRKDVFPGKDESLSRVKCCKEICTPQYSAEIRMRLTSYAYPYFVYLTLLILNPFPTFSSTATFGTPHRNEMCNVQIYMLFMCLIANLRVYTDVL